MIRKISSLVEPWRRRNAQNLAPNAADEIPRSIAACERRTTGRGNGGALISGISHCDSSFPVAKQTLLNRLRPRAQYLPDLEADEDNEGDDDEDGDDDDRGNCCCARCNLQRNEPGCVVGAHKQVIFLVLVVGDEGFPTSARIVEAFTARNLSEDMVASFDDGGARAKCDACMDDGWTDLRKNWKPLE